MKKLSLEKMENVAGGGCGALAAGNIGMTLLGGAAMFIPGGQGLGLVLLGTAGASTLAALYSCV